MAFIKVATLADLHDDCGHCVEVNGKRIGLYRVDGAVYAIDDMCTHADASLCDGDLEGDEVVCPLHFATFNVKTGRCTAAPADEDVATYVVRVNGEDVEVDV